MENIKLDLFDIFGYLIPGSILLFAGWVLCDSSIVSVSNISQSLGKIDSKIGAIFLLVSYSIGFAGHYFGSKYYMYHNKLFGFKELEVEKATEKWILVREFASNHLSVLDRWALLKAMSQNLASTALLSSLFSVVKFGFTRYFEWLFVALVLLYFSHVFILRARRFAIFRDHDLTSLVDTLNLKNKLNTK